MLKTQNQTSNQKGTVLVLVAILLFVFVGIGALALDIGHLVIIGNELQNAADAGALAGARVLINPDGTINPDANFVAYQTALSNLSGGVEVTINDWSSNNGDIRRGHWTFAIDGAIKGFTPNSNLTQGGLFSGNQNSDVNLINAIEITVSRGDIPSLFAGIFNIFNFQRTKTAVGYIGFAGSFEEGELDQPLAICMSSIIDVNGNLTCTTGRMISDTVDTGAWTDFNQPSTCDDSGAATPPNVNAALCTGNPNSIIQGNLRLNNGQMTPTYRDFRECWNGTSTCNEICGRNYYEDSEGDRFYTNIDLWDSAGNSGPDGIPDQPWNLTLPVIDCDSPESRPNCAPIVGAVNLSVVWITESNPGQQTVPSVMYHPGLDRTWTRDPAWNDVQAWNSFASFFGLVEATGNPLPHSNKAIYILPTCEVRPPRGITGGTGFGVQAQYPVLVQ